MSVKKELTALDRLRNLGEELSDDEPGLLDFDSSDAVGDIKAALLSIAQGKGKPVQTRYERLPNNTLDNRVGRFGAIPEKGSEEKPRTFLGTPLETQERRQTPPAPKERVQPKSKPSE